AVPTVAVAGPLLLIARFGTGAGLTCVSTGGLVLLPVVLSPPPLTTAVLLAWPTLSGVTLIVATGTLLAPAPIGVLEVQVTVCPAAPHVKLGPLVTLLIASAAGTASVTVMVPLVASEPTFASERL